MGLKSFHEAGHVYLQHSKKELCINDGVADDPQEQAADAFAAESVIPRAYDAVIQGIRRAEDIKALAEQLCQAPSFWSRAYESIGFLAWCRVAFSFGSVGVAERSEAEPEDPKLRANSSGVFFPSAA